MIDNDLRHGITRAISWLLILHLAASTVLDEQENDRCATEPPRVLSVIILAFISPLSHVHCAVKVGRRGLYRARRADDARIRVRDAFRSRCFGGVRSLGPRSFLCFYCDG